MESEPSHNVSSDEKDDSTTSIIKIELEKISSPQTAEAATVDKNPNSVNAGVSNVDTSSANGNNEASSGVETQGKDPVEAVGNDSIVEVPVTGITYVKSIGNSAPEGTAGASESVDVEFIKPVQPYTVSIVHGKTAGSDESHEKSEPVYKDVKHGDVELYGEDCGPRIYNVKGNIISRPIITKNLPEIFRAQPVHGKAESKAGLQSFFDQKLRDYIGYGISDNEFGKLQNYMDGDFLRTGYECSSTLSFPSQGPFSVDMKSSPPEIGRGQHLCVVKKLQLRLKKDLQNHYPKKLKYRGLRMRPLSLEDDDDIKEMPKSNDSKTDGSKDVPLEPGKDLIFRVRIYRPHSYGSKDHRDKKPARHSVFNNDAVLLGRQRLAALRDHIACPNDTGLRVDVSESPDSYAEGSAKDMFPSGFLFINNVFYVDRRPGCVDHSAGVRAWARRRGFGAFPVRSLATSLDQLVLRLGHPEVYMHQGKCEHLFVFSEVRLLSAGDPQRLTSYPRHSLVAQNQSVYCTTCAEFAAKWVVVGCARVPFDPAFFCDTCFRFYLYDRHGNKIGDFKAYSYRGCSVNFMKPVGALPPGDDDDEDDE